jgi:hypothetical protein
VIHVKAKYLIVSGLILMLILSAATGFAENSNSPHRQGTSEPSGQGQEGNTYRHQYQEKLATISRNRLMIAELNLQVREEALQLRERIQELRDDPQGVGAGEVARIRECLRLIASGRQQLRETLGHVHQHMQRFRHNRQQNNWEGCLEDMDSIIEVQKARIRILTKLMADLEALNQQL